MSRLIDTMGYDELGTFIDYLASAEADLDEPEMRQELEKLFAPAPPHWSENLTLTDDQTWVFCFVSDSSTEDTRYAEWIELVSTYGYRAPRGRSWKYATPVDLGLRYNNGEDTL